MKIAEITVGTEYGALDEVKKRYNAVDPRQVKVLEIVTVEVPNWNSYTHELGTRKVKRVKVEVLNGPDKADVSYRHGPIKRAARGDTLVIDARQIVGPWKALNKDILNRVAMAERKEARKASVENRLKALGFKCDYDEAHYTNSSIEEVEFRGEKAIEKLLTMLGAKQ